MEKDQGPDNTPTLVLKGDYRNGAGPVCLEKHESQLCSAMETSNMTRAGQFPESPGGVTSSILMTRSKFPFAHYTCFPISSWLELSGDPDQGLISLRPITL